MTHAPKSRRIKACPPPPQLFYPTRLKIPPAIKGTCARLPLHHHPPKASRATAAATPGHTPISVAPALPLALSCSAPSVRRRPRPTLDIGLARASVAGLAHLTRRPQDERPGRSVPWTFLRSSGRAAASLVARGPSNLFARLERRSSASP
ncbi:hypothetical protein EJ06DRAFT_557477 [Trichodelitschia bisporula]|uniref:Uncharacterized protein n=1 Tax=Trichodelitschia bisporula TaxID=703511 RepID=A0A6G1HUH2_9PEZI|nr:hypothetical protein EJ06DRAFT_557477 [Trichodelitschia bisporula]